MGVAIQAMTTICRVRLFKPTGLRVVPARSLCSTAGRNEAAARKEREEAAQVDAEVASVKSLITLGRRLAAQAGSNHAPQRLRGIGCKRLCIAIKGAELSSFCTRLVGQIKAWPVRGLCL